MRSFAKIAWMAALTASAGCMGSPSELGDEESDGAEETAEAALADGTATPPSPPCGPGTLIQSMGLGYGTPPGYYGAGFYSGFYPAGAYGGGFLPGYGGLGFYGGYGGGFNGYGYGLYNQGLYGAQAAAQCGCGTTPPP